MLQKYGEIDGGWTDGHISIGHSGRAGGPKCSARYQAIHHHSSAWKVSSKVWDILLIGINLPYFSYFLIQLFPYHHFLNMLIILHLTYFNTYYWFMSVTNYYCSEYLNTNVFEVRQADEPERLISPFRQLGTLCNSKSLDPEIIWIWNLVPRCIKRKDSHR